MKNVWLSMEHQSILWCNQLAVQVETMYSCQILLVLYSMFQYFTYVDINLVQVAHTLLSMIDPVNGQPVLSPQKRVFVFAKMLQSAVPQSLSWMTHVSGSQSSNFLPSDKRDASGTTRSFPCYIICIISN